VRCDSGSWAGRRLSLADYVTVGDAWIGRRPPARIYVDYSPLRQLSGDPRIGCPPPEGARVADALDPRVSSSFGCVIHFPAYAPQVLLVVFLRKGHMQ
jgi:hypothetical protein